MNKLSKQKKDQLILILLGTVVFVVAIWMGLLGTQKKALVRLKATVAERQNKVRTATDLLSRAQAFEGEMSLYSGALKSLEETMSDKGDPFAWMVKTVNRLRSVHTNINIIDITKDAQVDVSLLPKFPYKAVMFQLKGTAYYHDFGKFITDFENSYPFARVQNIDLVSTSASQSEEREKLHFTFEVVTLVAPTERNGI